MPSSFTWMAPEGARAANSKALILALCLMGFAVPASFGFQSSVSSCQRTFAGSVTLTNWPVAVTATFTNGEGTLLNGFFYSDQVPTALSVTPLSLTLNGRAVTNYIFESGQDGDVYPDYTPYRWILEEPPGFSEINPVPAPAVIQIVYAVSASSPGSFSLHQFSWVAYESGLTNAVFGYSESDDQQSLQFVTTSYQPSLAGQYATNGFTLQLVGVPEYRYALERSSNLSGWIALTTNASPFAFTDTNTAGLSRCFYRARWLP